MSPSPRETDGENSPGEAEEGKENEGDGAKGIYDCDHKKLIKSKKNRIQKANHSQGSVLQKFRLFSITPPPTAIFFEKLVKIL